MHSNYSLLSNYKLFSDHIFSLRFFSIILLLLWFSCNNVKKDSGQSSQSNHLINEISPYLLQHAHNPVNWYPWKDEALELALKSRKLMVVSIGYSSCHWCHVMERESFSDTAVSRIMNQDFISIKVDREERPDVDQIYMNACQIVNSGACGWPLNAITLPDGRPIWIGTYLTKDEWIKLLISMQAVYQEDPNEFEKMALRIQNHLSVDYSQYMQSSLSPVTKEKIDLVYQKIGSGMDKKHGGKESAQKFPLPSLHRSLLDYSQYSSKKVFDQYLNLSLTRILNGGIYDQLDGGFFRYTVDSEWKIPHFEKMLYDNAQLISLYSLAYQKSNNENYKTVAQNSMDFVLGKMRHPDGMFYSSFDAETEGEEGKYYVWTVNEIDQLLTDPIENKIFKSTYNISSSGNWEKGKNVLFIANELQAVASEMKIDKNKTMTYLVAANNKVLEVRNKRSAPLRDEKILTSWNALMIKACADASVAFSRKDYLDAAIKAAAHLQNNMFVSERGLSRNFMNGKSSISGFLEDYSYSVEAFIRLYELTFDEKYLNFAKELVEVVIRDFSDEAGIYFYFTSKSDRKLITRKVEFEDQVTPSANSVMAESLHKLGLYFYDSKYLDRAAKMVQGVLEQFGDQQPEFYANWMRLAIFQVRPLYEIAIVGPEAAKIRDELAKNYLPNAILLGGETEGQLELLKEKLQEGQTYIYVCRNKVCKLPVTKVLEAIPLIQ
ncbi:MAG: thioredoxin domain-containing protein [Saprospiraceae bacterium]|nr:thioredoxin domain-containing protein [Saprospiraceae bacterium]